MRKYIIIFIIAVFIISGSIIVFTNYKEVPTNSNEDEIVYIDNGLFDKYAVVIEYEVIDEIDKTPIYVNGEWDYRTEYSNEEFLTMPCIYNKNDIDSDIMDEIDGYCLNTNYVALTVTKEEASSGSKSIESTLIDGYYGTLYKTEPFMSMVYFYDGDDTVLSAEVMEGKFNVRNVKIYHKRIFEDYKLEDEFFIGFNTHFVSQRQMYKSDFDNLIEE